jgi:hypothetical protein
VAGEPTEQHRKLQALVGSWEGQETMSPSPWDPEGGTARSRVEARLELDGMYVIYDYVQERDGRVTYRGHGVYGWDDKRRAYTMYWFDSMGMDPGGPACGTWEGDTLTFQMATPMGQSRYIHTFRADGKYDFRGSGCGSGGVTLRDGPRTDATTSGTGH